MPPSEGIVYRCPNCKTETPIADRRQTTCACPTCGLTGIIPRKAAGPGARATRTVRVTRDSSSGPNWAILGISIGGGVVALTIVIALVVSTTSRPRQTTPTVESPGEPPRPAVVVPSRQPAPTPIAKPTEAPIAPKPPVVVAETKSQAKPAEPVVVIIPPTPAESKQPAPPAVIVIPPADSKPAVSGNTGMASDLAGWQAIAVPDGSFEGVPASFMPKVPGWTDTAVNLVRVVHQISNTEKAGKTGQNFLRLYMQCGQPGAPSSPVWDFRSDPLGRFQANMRYRATVSLSRDGTGSRKVALSLCTADAICATKEVEFNSLGMEFTDHSVDLDVPANSKWIGQELRINIRYEGVNEIHGRNLDIDNIRLYSQPMR